MDTLSNCSLKLMEILIISNQKQVDKLQAEISSIQTDMVLLQARPDFMELDGRLNKKLDKLKKCVIDTKKGQDDPGLHRL